MRMEMVKEEGNADPQLLLLPEFSGEHSHPETASDVSWHLRLLQSSKQSVALQSLSTDYRA